MTRHVHVLGICGYAASGAAMLARQAGDRVTGSDDFIEWENRSDPANLERWGVPDLVVVGNQTRATNPEFIAVKQRGLRFISEIEFYVSLVGDRPRLTVCGTHGKTTTAALLAHMLERAGLDPGFRLGALSLDLGGTSRLGSGPFVFEGDEYTTAPWDARPKFLHTKPVAACASSSDSATITRGAVHSHSKRSAAPITAMPVTTALDLRRQRWRGSRGL